jgi:hypothetical protein
VFESRGHSRAVMRDHRLSALGAHQAVVTLCTQDVMVEIGDPLAAETGAFIAVGPITPQMATTSECRYRLLRVPDLNLFSIASLQNA